MLDIVLVEETQLLVKDVVHSHHVGEAACQVVTTWMQSSAQQGFLSNLVFVLINDREVLVQLALVG